MFRPKAAPLKAVAVVLLASLGLAGCASKVTVTKVRLSERECLARAMYFESNRSSDAGMLAVGTVVMNRLKSGRYGATVCEVVGAPRQFAPGVLTRPMTDRGAPRARRMADVVLSGKRHPGVQNAQFFHTAGYKFPYNNMRYVLVAGGNAFYDKRKPPKTWYGGDGRWGPPPAPDERVDGVMVAQVDVIEDQPQPAARPSRATAVVEAAPRRPVEVADARAAYGGVPTYEPLPTAADRAAPSRRNATVVAALDRPVASGRQVREDNGLREEDRWRDQELAEEAGRAPANDGDWRERRDARVESEPLPVIETAPAPQAPRQPSPRSRTRDYQVAAAEPVYEAPRPIRTARVVNPRTEPVEADPAALGWRAGPPPARMGDAASADRGAASDDMGGYQPLSQAATEDASRPQARRTAEKASTRSYGGVTLEDQPRYGYR